MLLPRILFRLVGDLLFPLFSIWLSLALPVRAVETLTDEQLRNIPPAAEDDFDIHSGRLLAPILIPRVSGTEGSTKVQQHFVDFFTDNLPDWELLWQNSTSKTPVTGDEDVPFTNLVFRRDPPWARPGEVSRLTLVAHFDSKYTPEGFIGATDSAAPCAMLMHVAQSIDAALTSKWEAMNKSDGLDDGLDTAEGIQIIFLDGEEAFAEWTDTDSIYGARSMAEEWESAYHPSMSTFRTELDSISLFVLLDLLGAKDPRIPSYFITTHWAYRNLAALEKRMRDLDLLETQPPNPFLPQADKKASRFGRSPVADDHVPFLKRGVHILHLITLPFPDVWHKIEDDGEHLDPPTVRDWGRVMTAFTAEFMGLGKSLPKNEEEAAAAAAAASGGQDGSETMGAPSKRTEL